MKRNFKLFLEILLAFVLVTASVSYGAEKKEPILVALWGG